MTSIKRAIRSEFIRLRRNWTLPAAAVGLTVLATFFVFAGDGPTRGQEEATVVDVDTLAQPGGIVAGLDVAASLIGLFALVLWALSVSRDLQTGSIRVLLVTQARRRVYLGGKLIALTATTIAMGIGCVLASVLMAHGGAASNDISTDAWVWSEVWSTLGNVTIASLVWGALGAALAMAARSASAAIAGGIGYMLLGENLIGSLWSSAGEWLPSGTLDNLLEGGTEAVSYSRSVSMALVYLVAGVAASLIVISRRDVTD